MRRAVDGAAWWGLRLLVLVAAAAVLGWVLLQVRTVVVPLALAVLLSALLRPPARVLARAMPDPLAALLVVGGLLGLVVLVGRLLAPRVQEQWAELVDQVGFSADDWRGVLADDPLGVDSRRLTDAADDLVERLQDSSEQLAATVASGLLTGARGVGAALLTAVLALVLTFFFVKDGHRFLPWARGWLGPDVGRHVEALGGRLAGTFATYLWSLAAVALVDAVLIGLGLWLLEVPFALTLAVLIFFAGFIPIVGAVTTGVLAVLVALLSQGPGTALLVLALVLAVQQLESNLLQPVLVGRVLALHPAVVLSVITAGGVLAGIVGAFLAVPAASAFAVCARYAREQAVPAD